MSVGASGGSSPARKGPQQADSGLAEPHGQGSFTHRNSHGFRGNCYGPRAVGTMLDRFLAALAQFVTHHRRAVLVTGALLTALCGAALPWLETESSPENLLISFGGYAERVERFREQFGDTDNVMVLLVEAEDATTRDALSYQHQLARRFATEPEVLRVDGLTVSPIPRGPGAEASVEDVGTLDDLDALEAEVVAPEDPDVREALEALVDSAPDRFPLGLGSVAERATEADRSAIVSGDEVTDADAAAIRAAIEESPLVVGRLVSADRTLGAVVVSLRAELGTGDERVAFVQRMDRWLEANPAPNGHVVHRAGLPHLRTAIVAYMLRDQFVLVPLTVLVCVVLLYLSFRWVPGTVLPLIAVGVSVVLTLGGMALVGERMTILTNIVPTLLIIIALSDSVHLIARWEEELRGMKVPDPVAAAARSLRTMAVACFLTSITTAVGLGSLMVSHTQMLQRFGGVAGIGTMIAYVVTILVIPAALPFFKPPVALGDISERPAAEAGLIERATVAGTEALLRRPWTVLLVCVLIFVPTVYATTFIRVDTSLHDTFSQEDPVVIAVHRMDERMDGIRPLEIMLSTPEEGRLPDPDVAAVITDNKTLLMAHVIGTATGHTLAFCTTCNAAVVTHYRPSGKWPTCRLTPGCAGRHEPRDTDVSRLAAIDAPQAPKQAAPPRKPPTKHLLGPRPAWPTSTVRGTHR